MRKFIAGVTLTASLAVGAPAAQAAVQVPQASTQTSVSEVSQTFKIVEFCKLTIDYFFYADKNRPFHMIAKFHIYCNAHPRHTRNIIDIEWWNPKGGKDGKGGWETAPCVLKDCSRFAPRSIKIDRLDQLPKPHGTKHYRLASKCRIGDKMAVHAFGKSVAPDGKITKYNFWYPSLPGIKSSRGHVYC